MNVKKLYYTLEEVAFVTSLSTASIQSMVAKEEFPASRLLSGRRVGWLAREIDEWCEERPVADLAPPPNTGHSNRRKKEQVAA